MDRFDKHVVDIAVMAASRPDSAVGANTAYVLAAEVQALREEIAEALQRCEDWRTANTTQADSIVKLRATIARVEALPAKWLDYVVLQTGEGIPDCAKDLEDALRGES